MNEIMLSIAPHISFQDPVCGTAHLGMASYWSKKLGKCDLKAYQVLFFVTQLEYFRGMCSP